MQDCWVKNNINLPKNRLTIHFVTYISRVLISHRYSPFIHIYCLVSCCLTSATVIYITMLWMKIVTCWCMIWMKSLRFCGVIYIKIYWHLFDIIIYHGNKAVYISRVLISQKYSPFLHIYCLISCCLTCATVIYITMLWMKIVTCWCMIWMKLLRFCGVIYITIYWHTFSIYIIYHGNKAVYISWIDAKKLAHNSPKPVQDCYVNNNIKLAQNRQKIMEKVSSPPKTYLRPKSCSDCSCRLSCKNWIFYSCELMTHQLQKLHT